MMSAKIATRENVDKKLLRRLRIYSLIFLIMLSIVIYDIITSQLTLSLAAAGLGIGVIIGAVMSRMFRLSWDEQASVVIGRIDWIGGAILVAYILFAIVRNRIFGFWVTGTMIGVFTLSFFAGNMLGRVIGTVVNIRYILRAWGLGL